MVRASSSTEKSRNFHGVEIALTSAALLIAPLAIGAVHLPTRIILTGSLLVGLGVMVFPRWRSRKRLDLGYFGLGLSILLFWTFVQWMPLPASLIALLSPESAEAREIAAAVLPADAMTWHPMSFDGGRTAMMWLTLLGYWIVFVMCRNGVQRGWGRRLPLVVLFCAALLVMCVGVVHSLLDLRTEIYGFYPAGHRRWAAPFVTSFVNANHGAACMVLGAGAGLSLWFSVREQRRRWFVLVGVLFLTLGTIGTGSRAAILLLPLLLLAISGVGFLSGQSAVVRRHLLNAVVGTLCLCVVMTLVFASERWHELVLSQMSFSSLFTEANFHGRWHLGWEVAWQHLGVGAGLGTFGVVSPGMAGAGETGLMDHAHNLFLQFIADWGLPVSLLAGGLMGFDFISRVWRRRAEPELLVVAFTILTLLIHNMVDFSFHIPGIGLLVMAMLGWLTADPPSEKDESGLDSSDEGVSFSHRRVRLPTSPTLILVLGGCFALTTWHAVAQDPESWGERARAQLASETEDRLFIESMIMEHPSDFYLFTVASALSWEVEDKDRAWALIDRAVELAPLDVSTRLARARLFLADDRSLEAVPDLLVLTENGKAREVIREVLRWPTATRVLEQVLSREEEHVLELVSVLRAHGKPGDIRRVLEWGMNRFPESVELAEAMAEHVMWTPGHTDELDVLATKILTGGVDNPDLEISIHRRRTGYLLQGFVHHRRKQPLQAYHLFLEAAELDPSKEAQPLVLAADALLTLNKKAIRLRAILKRLEPSLNDFPIYRHHYHRLLSFQHEREGNPRRAIEEMHRAILYAPKRPSYEQRLSQLYEAVGEDTASGTHLKRYEQLMEVRNR